MRRYYVDAALSAVLVGTLVLHYGHFLPAQIDFILIIVVAVAGTLPVFWSAWRAVKEKEWASMDMLASIALAFSLASAQWAPAVFIALMLAAARILDEVTSERTEQSIKSLLKLRPETAKIERNGKIETVKLAEIVLGDTVVVDLGERVPVDGTVLSGEAAVDESSLTGESLPVEKKKDSKVFSSTLVSSGSLKIKAEKVGKDTTLEKIIKLVESSREEKPKTQTMGERFGKFYLISVFAVSALLLFFTQNVPLVLSVVLVVCADDIAVAIPLAYLGAIGAAARRGVIIKGAKHLETLGNAKIIVFDKTGTLTKGVLAVSCIVAESKFSVRQVLESGSLSVRRSEHPLSLALVAYANARGVKEEFPDTFEQVAGSGVRAVKNGKNIIVGKKEFLQDRGVAISNALIALADEQADQGHSISFIAEDGTAIGFAAISAEIKANAKRAISELKKLGIKKTVMLTGDNERTARAVAKKLGIDIFHANLLPEDKVKILKEFAKDGAAMVGDGVNDAAALAGASVGIAMGGIGSDVAIESAEIVLMRDDLMMIPEVVALARTVRAISVEDFWIWGVTNAFGLVLVFAGFIGPSGAAAFNFITDFFPLANSARVRLPAGKADMLK